jgi:hypothetical protein
MPISHERSGEPDRAGPIRAPQSLAGGLFLLVLAALALWLNRNLARGNLRSMGPAMLPDWLAIAVGLCGLALLVFAFVKNGEALERWSLRGPLLVLVSILAFAMTIRPFSFGPISIPGLGLIVAGPLAIIIGGFATPEVRLRDLVILALSLTPFCMVLFGDALDLPIPIFPQAVANLFPADWSQKLILRVIALIMVALAGLVFALGRGQARQRIDVADHSGTI